MLLGQFQALIEFSSISEAELAKLVRNFVFVLGTSGYDYAFVTNFLNLIGF